MIEDKLNAKDIDVLGEIGNISMGTSATTLSQLLRQDVSITTPRVEVKEFDELFGGFKVPYIVIKVNYISGIHGYNLLVIKLTDAKAMLRMLMGDRVEDTVDFDSMEMSALSEIMNQMMGASSTSLNQVYKSSIQISTPEIQFVDVTSSPESRPDIVTSEPLVTVTFNFRIGDIVDSQALQVIPLSSAKEQAGLMLEAIKTQKQEAIKAQEQEAIKAQEQEAIRARQQQPKASKEVVVEKAEFPPLQKNSSGSQPRSIEFLLDIPLDASVVLGKISKSIQQVLSLREGSVIELDKLVEEPVDLYINGVPLARGEIVVVNENFGLRITEIVSSSQRLESLSSLKKL